MPPQQKLIWLSLIIAIVVIVFIAYIFRNYGTKGEKRRLLKRNTTLAKEVESSAEAMRTLAEQIKRADAALAEAAPDGQKAIPCPSCGARMTPPTACASCGWKNPLW